MIPPQGGNEERSRTVRHARCLLKRGFKCEIGSVTSGHRVPTNKHLQVDGLDVLEDSGVS